MADYYDAREEERFTGEKDSRPTPTGDPQPGPGPADDGFLSVPCPEFYDRPIRIRVRDRKLEYAEGSEGYQEPRSASIEEEALYQAVKESLTVESQGAPSPAPAGDQAESVDLKAAQGKEGAA